MKPIITSISGGGFIDTWPNDQDIIMWPEYVHINNRYYDLYDYTMHDWLRDNIGYKSFDWNIFFNTNRVEYRFKTIEDKMSFVLRWTYQ